VQVLDAEAPQENDSTKESSKRSVKLALPNLKKPDGSSSSSDSPNSRGSVRLQIAKASGLRPLTKIRSEAPEQKKDTLLARRINDRGFMLVESKSA